MGGPGFRRGALPIVLAIPVLARQPMAEQILRQGGRLGLTLALAALSFRFIEQPIQRDRRWLTSRRRVLVAVLASSSLVVAVALPATALPGTLAEQMAVRTDQSCSGGETFEHLISCPMPAGADPVRTPPSFALLGDSLGRALGPGLDDWARTTGNTWVKAAWRRCPSTGVIVLSGTSTQPDSAARSCHEQAPTLIRTMLDTYHPSVVLISETWTSDHSILVDGANAAPGTPEHSAAVRTGYERLVDEISAAGGRAVFVELAPVGDSLGVQYAPDRPAGTHRPTALDPTPADRHNALLREVVAARPGKAELVSITDVLCPNGSCPAVIDGTLLRKDGTHYTLGFSRQLAPILLARAGVRSALPR